MSGALVSALATLALAWQETPPQDPPQPEPVAAGQESEHEGYCSPQRFALTLSEIATKYPDFVRVESLGKSASGSDIPLITLARLEGDSPLERPAMLVVASLEADDLFGTELAVSVARSLAVQARRDESLAALLGRIVVYIVPCLNVDLRAQAFAALESGSLKLAPRKVDLDRNFPAGWDPLGERSAGPYPLSEPEARALAEFVVARPNIVVCTRWLSKQEERLSGETWPAADQQAHERLCAGLGAQGLEAISRAGGSFLRFAYVERGAFVCALGFPFQRGGPLALPQVAELAGLRRKALASTVALARALPRIEVSAPVVAEIGPGQWAIELELRNSGDLPTSSALATELAVTRAPELEVRGARVVAAALVSDGEARSLAVRGERVALRELGAGERLALRIFVSGEAGAPLRLSVVSARGGRTQADAALR